MHHSGLVDRLRLLAGLLIMSLPGLALAQGYGGGAGFGRGVEGTVTATAPDHLTVKTEQGETWQIFVTTNTRLMKQRDPMKVGDIKVGDMVVAMGNNAADTHESHAAMLMVVDAARVKEMRDNLGKTYIAGKITAMDETKLTIQRPDGVSQVIEVDENTSFRKGGRGMANGTMGMMGGGTSGGGRTAPPAPADPSAESITLADFKTGDNVAGQGALKGNTFVPTQLVLMQPGARGAGARRRQGDGSGAATTPAPQQ